MSESLHKHISVSSVAIEWSYTCPRDLAFEDDRPRLAGRWLERANLKGRTLEVKLDVSSSADRM